MSVSVQVRGADQLRDLAKRLDEASNGKGLRKELLKGIREAAKPAAAATRTAVRTIPVTGSRGGGRKAREKHAFRSFGKTLDKAADLSAEEFDAAGLHKKQARAERKAREGRGLRATIASAIRVLIKTGSRNAAVRIEVDENKLPEDQRVLPRHLDSRTGWRHPLFGDRAHWYPQKGRPWFAVTIRKFAPAVRKQVVQAMDDVAKKIEG